MNGGDLRFHINRKTFTEEAVRFWIAELGCALRYVHQQHIVHRDVKPDNVLLDSEGHVHLADFNVASDLVPGKSLTSKSGTLAYLAPEVYAGRGYSSEVDWWSLGVLFYECIYNKRPFDANTHDALAQAVIKGEPPYPTTQPAVSQPCLKAMRALLEKHRSRRIGAAGFNTFSNHPFFKDIDFDRLERKQITPVFCPSSEKANFDATYDLEELLLEEAPLEARSRKQKPRAELREDATQEEIRADELHRMIETMFEPFDYTLVPQERSPIAPSEMNSIPPAIADAASSTSPNPPTPGAEIKDPLTTEAAQQPPVDKTRSIPTPRSQTPVGISRTRSANQTPEGSPPLATNALTADQPMPPPTTQPKRDNTVEPIRAAQTRRASDSLDDYKKRSRDPRKNGDGSQRGKALTKKASKDSSNDSTLVVDKSTPGHLSAPTSDEQRRGNDRPSGMLGFFNRKKGRDRSPKQREPGVLGKEGARIVVNH